MDLKKVIVAPLNWGLGHATRCIPIIESLANSGYTPVIASDGEALHLLQKEFPDLESIELPSYHIRYKKRLKLGLIWQLPKLTKAVKKEQQVIADYSIKNDVYGIISDNRFGVRSDGVPSVYLTHQLQVLSGITTFFTTTIHQRIIRKFDQCWVPDFEGASNLSGLLSNDKNLNKHIIYLGAISRLKLEKKAIKIDVLVLLSGPEPQRSNLEALLLLELEKFQGRVVLVKGLVEASQIKSRQGNLFTYNYVLRDELQDLINTSEIIVCRSGYSSILDLAKLEKKAFFIPTPNQTEQEYLAHNLESQGIAPYARQDDFKLELLENVKNYNGFQNADNSEIAASLFNLFERERKS